MEHHHGSIGAQPVLVAENELRHENEWDSVMVHDLPFAM
jgi:hypothetical protein